MRTNQIPRVIAGRSIERVLKLCLDTLDTIPVDAPEWEDPVATCVDDLRAILKEAEFVDNFVPD